MTTRNCYVERLIGSLRRKCLDHVLIVSEAHLQKVLDEYCDFFNGARPHQGIGQRRPATSETPALADRSALDCGAVVAHPGLGGRSTTTTISPHNRRACSQIASDELIGPDSPL
jgi:hypothetical protein